MNDQLLVAATASLIVLFGLWRLARKQFDPFEPIWLFLVGYIQVYVIQALSYREYALRARGIEVVTTANLRALWALAWFLLIYQSALGRWLATRLPRAPVCWSSGVVLTMSPLMFLWGLVCSGIAFYQSSGPQELSPEGNLLRQFPIMMLGAGALLVVTGCQSSKPRPLLTWTGLAIAAGYVLIWMYNGKRSHSLIGLLVGFGAYYLARRKRPSLLVLGVIGLAGTLVVSLALGWRSNPRYERSFNGFLQFVSEFDASAILINLNLKDREEPNAVVAETRSYETEEYGGYLLMLDTVPSKSPYDHGASYLRLISTYIPRIVWPDKPYYGRAEWLAAWQAGSEFKREAWFTGPAVSILGATQLNGGPLATLIVLAAVALIIRTAYEYFRLYAHAPWAQFWWAMTYYNAWLMTVNDDPFVWFYYIYGHTILPPMVFFWVFHRLAGGRWQWEAEEGSPELSYEPTYAGLSPQVC